jgi:N12 class adenine-specific DNA methylase
MRANLEVPESVREQFLGIIDTWTSALAEGRVKASADVGQINQIARRAGQIMEIGETVDTRIGEAMDARQSGTGGMPSGDGAPADAEAAAEVEESAEPLPEEVREVVEDAIEYVPITSFRTAAKKGKRDITPHEAAYVKQKFIDFIQEEGYTSLDRADRVFHRDGRLDEVLQSLGEKEDSFQQDIRERWENASSRIPSLFKDEAGSWKGTEKGLDFFVFKEDGGWGLTYAHAGMDGDEFQTPPGDAELFDTLRSAANWAYFQIHERGIGEGRDLTIRTGEGRTWPHNAGHEWSRQWEKENGITYANFVGETDEGEVDAGDEVGSADEAPEPGLEPGEDIDLTDYDPVALTRSEREEINEEALGLLQKQREELTAEDIDTLRQYTGRGGLEAETDEEGVRALNEHYTAYSLIEAMWSTLGDAGYTSGNVLEPGAGIGNFTGFAPDPVTMLMVERSNISARIAELLYPSHEVINDSITQVVWDRYQLTGAVGNVPFGSYSIAPSGSPFGGTQIHDYFILTALEECEPGSPVALITSTGTMDKSTPRARKMMMERAHFVDAFRLPSTMFQENADTLVTTDLIFFQVRDGKIAQEDFGEREETFVNVVEKTVESAGETYEVGLAEHYDNNPGRALGRLEAGLNSQFVSQWGVDGEKADAVSAVETAALDFPLGFPEDRLLHALDEEEGMEDLSTSREYPYGAVVHVRGEFREKKNIAFETITGQIPDSGRERVKSACNLLDRYADFIAEKAKNPEVADAGAVREAIDLHVEQYGLPANDELLQEVFRYDPRWPKLKIMAERGEDGDLQYADVLLSTRVYSERYRDQIEDTSDLVEVTTYLRAQGEPLNAESYAQVYEGGTSDEEDVREAMSEHEDFFYDPQEDRHVFRYEYLAGDIFDKMQAAEQAELDRNLDALQEALPEQANIFEIDLSPRHVTSYVPSEAIERWVASEIGLRSTRKVDVVASSETVGDETVEVFRCDGPKSSKDRDQGWGTKAYSQIVDIYLKGNQFPRTVVDEDGNPVDVSLSDATPEQTARANQYQEAWQQRMERQMPRDFQQWVRQEASTDMRDRIEEAYNRKYNSVATPEFDGSTFSVRGLSDTFKGMDDFEIFPHNTVVAEKMLWNLGGGDFHDVGSGKTLASIITVMAAQQRGAFDKTIFAVPGQVLRKWQSEFAELFPDASTLVIELQQGNRAEELAKAQAGDWNAVLMPLSAFKRLPLSPKVRQKALRRRISEIDRMLNAELERISDDAPSGQVARLERKYDELKAEYREKIQELDDIEEEEVDIYFDELGADSLVIDEAHAYKNALGTPLARQLGIAGSTSDRAERALQKARWVHRQHPDGVSGVFALTATPVQNSPIEVWHMMQLCAPQVLKEFGVENLDTFIRMFVEVGTETEKTITGSYDREQSITGYKNLDEMRRIVDQACDIKSYQQLQAFYEENPDLAANFERPPHDVMHEMVEATEIQDLLFDDLEIREEIVIQSYKDTDPGEDRPIKDNPLVVTGDGSRIANDLRIYQEEFGDIGSRLGGIDQKIDVLVENVKGYYEGDLGARMGGGAAEPESAADVGGTDTPDDIEAAAGETLEESGAMEPARANPARDNPSRDVAIEPVNRAAAGIGTPLREQGRENAPPRNQIVFSDQISLASGGTGDFFRLIKARLVEAGIPEDEIVILTGSEMTLPDGNGGFTERSPDDKQQAKLEIQERFNQGVHTVLLANQTAEEGMNLDKYGVATHHLDVPYRPTRLQQRNGRMVRQGNVFGSVDVLFYLLEGSFDEYRLQLVQSKQGWIDELFYGSDRKAEAQDTSKSLSYEEMQAATAEDERVADFFEARNEVSQLENRLDALESEEAELQATVATAEQDLAAIEERVMNTIETEQRIENQGFPYETPEEALESGDMEINISESYIGDDIEWELDLDMTEERSFGGIGEDLEIEIDVPAQNPNARVKYANPFMDVEQKRRRTYLVGFSFHDTPVRRSLRLARKELRRLPDSVMEQSESLRSFGRLLDLRDYDENPSKTERRAFEGRLLASDEWGYEQAGVEDPDEDRGDRSWEEYKEDLGFTNLNFWRPVLRQRIAALFWLLERRWHRRAGRRKEKAREEIEEVKSRLSGAKDQLQDVQSELEVVNESLQKNRETVSDLRDIVNEIQTRPYETRPEIYARINEIREDYGIENEIPMRIVQDDREGYLAYMRGAQAAIQRREKDDTGAAPSAGEGEEVEVPGANRTGPDEAPIVDTRRELAAVYEAQTGRELPDGEERRAVMERNVIVRPDSELLNEIADTGGYTDGIPLGMRMRLAASPEDLWTDNKMFLVGYGARAARDMTDLDVPEKRQTPIEPSQVLPPTENAKEISLEGVVGEEDEPIPLKAFATDFLAGRRPESTDLYLDAERIAFCLLMEDLDFTDVGDEVGVLYDTPMPGTPGAFLTRGSEFGAEPFAFVAGLERDSINAATTPITEPRDNPSGGAQDPEWVWIGFASDLTLSDGTEMDGQYAMLTPRGSQDALLLVPDGGWDVEGAAQVEGEALKTFEEWHDYPPRGVRVAVDPPQRPYEKAAPPEQITYLSDKIMREEDAKGKVHVYNHDFTDQHATLVSDDGTVMIAYEDRGDHAEETGTLQIDRRGIIN